MKIIYGFFILLAIIVSGCGSDSNIRPEPELPSPGGKVKRTVIAYWVADNSAKDLSTYAISDFNEMLEGMKSVDMSQNHLVIYIETETDLPHLIHIKKRNNQIVADTIHTYEEQNPLNVEVMTNIMERVVNEFPAENYGLIFCSHADGWLKASNSATRHLGEYRGTQMNITDFTTVLAAMPHLEFILFDACYMQSIEIAYQIRSYTDYVISSPTEIPAPGAPYHKVIPAAFIQNNNVGTEIAHAYYNYYGDNSGNILKARYTFNDNLYEWNYGVSISVISTEHLTRLAHKSKTIFSRYLSEREVIDIRGLFDYGCDIYKTIYYYDFDRLVFQITNGNEDYVEWRKIFDDVQPYFKTTKTNLANRKGGSFSMSEAQGIFTYVPKGDSEQHRFYQTLDWYNDGGWKETGW